ncbi:zinc ribbon domain-containing protein [Exiguobacterium mexicanum]|uniref:zinc ribbon domain-containing protein n=1 Tax=Exiguobacterium mexicanum TaxID=340146 RepID=UPI00110E9401
MGKGTAEALCSIIQSYTIKSTFYILTKLIRCPQCGAGIVAGKSKSANKTYRYYKCGTFHNKGASECSANSINADKAERQVLEEFKRIVTESQFLQRLIYQF